MLLSPVLVGKAKMMDDSVLVYFRQNIEVISKEEILLALENALRSADCWRDACLFGLYTSQEHCPKKAMEKSSAGRI
jgi:hypothetical protein